MLRRPTRCYSDTGTPPSRRARTTSSRLVCVVLSHVGSAQTLDGALGASTSPRNENGEHNVLAAHPIPQTRLVIQRVRRDR